MTFADFYRRDGAIFFVGAGVYFIAYAEGFALIEMFPFVIRAESAGIGPWATYRETPLLDIGGVHAGTVGASGIVLRGLWLVGP